MLSEVRAYSCFSSLSQSSCEEGLSLCLVAKIKPRMIKMTEGIRRTAPPIDRDKDHSRGMIWVLVATS